MDEERTAIKALEGAVIALSSAISQLMGGLDRYDLLTIDAQEAVGNRLDIAMVGYKIAGEALDGNEGRVRDLIELRSRLAGEAPSTPEQLQPQTQPIGNA